jgi:hypothetical protein
VTIARKILRTVLNASLNINVPTDYNDRNQLLKYIKWPVERKVHRNYNRFVRNQLWNDFK